MADQENPKPKPAKSIYDKVDKTFYKASESVAGSLAGSVGKASSMTSKGEPSVGNGDEEIRMRLTKVLRPKFEAALTWSSIFRLLEQRGPHYTEPEEIKAILDNLPYSLSGDTVTQRLSCYAETVQSIIGDIEEAIIAGQQENHALQENEQTTNNRIEEYRGEVISLETFNARQRETLDEKEEIISSLLTRQGILQLEIATLRESIQTKDELITADARTIYSLRQKLRKHEATAIANVTDEAVDEVVRHDTANRA